MHRLTNTQQKLAEDNIGLAYYFANKYRPPEGLDRDEWQLECLYRLCRAACTYTPGLGAFTTYAHKAMFNQRIKLNIKARQAKRDTSREATLTDAAASRLAAPEQPETVDNRDYIRACLGSLSLRERVVLLRNAQGMTIRELGERLGVSYQRVQQIHARALYLIRKERGIKVGAR